MSEKFNYITKVSLERSKIQSLNEYKPLESLYSRKNMLDIITDNIKNPKINELNFKDKKELEGIADQLKNVKISSNSMNNFLDSLKNSGIDGINSLLDNIDKKVINEIILTLILVAPLILSGVGAPTAFGIVASRIGVQHFSKKFIFELLSRPKVVEIINKVMFGIKDLGQKPPILHNILLDMKATIYSFSLGATDFIFRKFS